MKCTIPEISWHNREPILSADIFPGKQDFYRLATGGGDCHVLIWQLNITETGAVNQEVISDLTRHQRAVNCVRWSPTGQYLASGDDDSHIIIWQLKVDNIPLLEGDTGDKEVWIVYKVLRGHKEDVYDLSWSINETKMLSGSVDNTAILWDVHKGKMDHILSDHKGFVQGVAWDPKDQIIATISTDRTCRIFDPSGKHVKARIHKGKILSVPDNHYLKDREVKYFHDDTFKSFFRRLQFSPDGSLLIVPSGYIEVDNCKNALNGTLLFTLDNWLSPAGILPLKRQSSTVVRCCPILFELHEKSPEPYIKLPYRMIFAVGTDHDVFLYDTQQTIPFARFQDIHYTRLTDLSWSPDGLLLVASSTDGFCTLITFEKDELGIPWTKQETDEEEHTLNISGCEEIVDNDENIDIKNKVEEKISEAVKEEAKKRPSFLEQWAIKTPKKKKESEELKKKEDKTVEVEEIQNVHKSKSVTPNKVIEPEKRQRIVPQKIGEISLCKKQKTHSSVQSNKSIIIIDDSPIKESSGSNGENKEVAKVKRIVPTKIGEISISKNDTLAKQANETIDIPASNDRTNKASTDIRAFFSRKPKKKTALNIKNTFKEEMSSLVQSHSKEKKKPARRIVPQKIGEASTSKINVSSKLQNTQPTKFTGSDHLEEVAILDTEQLVTYQNASKEIQNFFRRKPNVSTATEDFTIDDKTEEFTLQLEDSQGSCDLSCTPNLKKESSCSNEPLKGTDQGVNAISSNHEDTEVNKGSVTSEENGCVVLPKTPKRLPFKTIASPRRKIKQKHEQNMEK